MVALADPGPQAADHKAFGANDYDDNNDETDWQTEHSGNRADEADIERADVEPTAAGRHDTADAINDTAAAGSVRRHE